MCARERKGNGQPPISLTPCPVGPAICSGITGPATPPGFKGGSLTHPQLLRLRGRKGVIAAPFHPRRPRTNTQVTLAPPAHRQSPTCRPTHRGKRGPEILQRGPGCKHSFVSRSGPAVRRCAGKQKGHGSISLRLSLLFKKVVDTTCDLIQQNIKMALIAAHL